MFDEVSVIRSLTPVHVRLCIALYVWLVLTSVNQPLLLKLQTLEKSEEVGWVFLEFVDLFKMYAVYCSNQARIGAIIEEAKKESAELKRLDERAMSDDLKTRNQGLRDFLILPMQRICRYPMLLENLAKYTEAPSLEHDVLNETLFRYKALVAQINEYTRRVENVGKLTAIEKRFANGKSLDLVQARRTVIWEGRLKLRLPRSVVGLASNFSEVDLQDGARCFLFDDLLISCAPQDVDDPKSPFLVKYLLDLSNCFNVHVESISDDQNKQGEDVGFEVVFQIHPETDSTATTQRKFKFKALTSSERDVWMKKFREMPLLIARRDVAALSQLNHHLSVSKDPLVAQPSSEKPSRKKRFERKTSMQEKKPEIVKVAPLTTAQPDSAGKQAQAQSPIAHLPADRSRSFTGDSHQNAVVSLKIAKLDTAHVSHSTKVLATARPTLAHSGPNTVPIKESATANNAKPTSPTSHRYASSFETAIPPQNHVPSPSQRRHHEDHIADKFSTATSPATTTESSTAKPAATTKWTPGGPPRIPLPNLPPTAAKRASMAVSTQSLDIVGPRSSSKTTTTDSRASASTIVDRPTTPPLPGEPQGNVGLIPTPTEHTRQDSLTSPRTKTSLTSPRLLGSNPSPHPSLGQTTRASSGGIATTLYAGSGGRESTKELSPRSSIAMPRSSSSQQPSSFSSQSSGMPSSSSPSSAAYGKFSGQQAYRNSDSSASRFGPGPGPTPMNHLSFNSNSSSPNLGVSGNPPLMSTTPLFGFFATSPITSPTSTPDSFSALHSQLLLRDFESVALGFIQCLQTLKLTPNTDSAPLPVNGAEIAELLKYVEEDMREYLEGKEAVRRALMVIRKRLENSAPISSGDAVGLSTSPSNGGLGGAFGEHSLGANHMIARLSPSASLTNLDHFGDLLESIVSSTSNGSISGALYAGAKMPMASMQASTSMSDVTKSGAPKTAPVVSQLDEHDEDAVAFDGASPSLAYGKTKKVSRGGGLEGDEDGDLYDADDDRRVSKRRVDSVKKSISSSRRASYTRSISEAGMSTTNAQVVSSSSSKQSSVGVPPASGASQVVSGIHRASPSPVPVLSTSKRSSAERSPRNVLAPTVTTSTIPSSSSSSSNTGSSSSPSQSTTPRGLEKRRSKGVLFSVSESSTTSPATFSTSPPPPSNLSQHAYHSSLPSSSSPTPPTATSTSSSSGSIPNSSGSLAPTSKPSSSSSSTTTNTSSDATPNVILHRKRGASISSTSSSKPKSIKRLSDRKGKPDNALKG